MQACEPCAPPANAPATARAPAHSLRASFPASPPWRRLDRLATALAQPESIGATENGAAAAAAARQLGQEGGLLRSATGVAPQSAGHRACFAAPLTVCHPPPPRRSGVGRRTSRRRLPPARTRARRPAARSAARAGVTRCTAEDGSTISGVSGALPGRACMPERELAWGRMVHGSCRTDRPVPLPRPCFDDGGTDTRRASHAADLSSSCAPRATQRSGLG
eukprot:363446-Chlamydomonas_euryale.AAC.11